ncbi:hypothetical protein ABPG75_005722 [Micractinium tetrahymenae]
MASQGHHPEGLGPSGAAQDLDEAVDSDQAAQTDFEVPLLPAADERAALPAAEEGRRIVAIAAPMVVEEALSYASTLIALAYAGRLGARALSVFALSHSLTNITGIALLNGVTGALDTYGSQAHGSGNFPAIGLGLQRALLLSLLTCLPLLALYAGSPWVLRAVLGQEAGLAAAAGRYTRIFAPKVPLHGAILCMYRTLASQGAAGYVLAASATFFAATAPINHLLMFTLGWGLDGSAAAGVCSEVVYACALAAMCALHNRRQAPEERWWRGWQAAAMTDWGPFIKLSLAATAMIVADWWLYDILTLLAGLLPDPELSLAASGVLYNLQTLIFMMPFGTAFAVCARVGHHLGAGRPRTARMAAEVGLSIGLLIVGLPALLLLLARDQAPALFTTDAAVVQACSALMLPLATLLVTNGATALLSGILRGCGQQKIGAGVNAAANYAAGLPFMLLLAFRLRLGVAGLWWGIAAAAALQAAVMAVLVSRFDWKREAARAAKLVRHLSTASLAASRPTSAAAEAPARDDAGAGGGQLPATWPPLL